MRDGKGGGRGRVLASGPSFCCMFCWRTAIHMNFGRWRGTLMPCEKKYKKRSNRRGTLVKKRSTSTIPEDCIQQREQSVSFSCL